MIVLDRIPLIVIQTRLGSGDTTPPFIKSKGSRLAKHLPPAEHLSGEEVYGRTKNCAVASLPTDLVRMGYRMVSVTSFERPDKKGGCETIVRFMFAHPELAEPFLAEPVAEITKFEDLVGAEFSGMMQTALWELQVFSNPLFREGKEMPDQRELRICLGECTPLFRADGKPVKIYPRDEAGRVCGFPKPLIAEHTFGFEGEKFLALARQ